MIDNIYIGNNRVISAYIGDVPIVQGTPTFNLHNSNLKNYLNNTNYSNDPDYTYTTITNYMYNYQLRADRPLPVILSVPNGSSFDSLIVDVSEDDSFVTKLTYNSSASNAVELYNLIPQKEYFYKVYGVSNGNTTLLKEGQFNTDGVVRMLYIDNIPNVRDLGGWSVGNSHIKYGKLIRSGELYDPTSSIPWSISESGIAALLQAGVSVEIDFGDYSTYSPLEEENVEFIHGINDYGIGAYNTPEDAALPGLGGETGRAKYHNVLSVMINRLIQGKTIIFHCNAGADRTGTVSFIIEALLGVSDDEKSKDYEITSFLVSTYGSGYCRRRDLSPGAVPGSEEGYGYKSMVKWIESNYSGSSLNEKVYDLCTKSLSNNGLELTSEQVTSLRNIMIE